jgi:hypothetical protein
MMRGICLHYVEYEGSVYLLKSRDSLVVKQIKTVVKECDRWITRMWLVFREVIVVKLILQQQVEVQSSCVGFVQL